MDKKVILNVLDHRASINAGSIAIQEGNLSITYSDLKEKSDAIASLLISKGITKGDVVGVFLESSINYVVVIIGINKAGGVFLPIETDYPEERISFIINQTKTSYIFLNESTASKLEPIIAKTIEPNTIELLCLVNDSVFVKDIVSNEMISVPRDVKNNPGCILNGDDSNYLMYTSGSTGLPKAILGCHKSLSHFLHWEMKEFALNEDIKVMQYAPLTFDVSLRDIFIPLLSGGTLYIPRKEIRKQPIQLIRWIGENGINLIHIVPSVFRLLIKELQEDQSLIKSLEKLQYVLLAGEPLYGRDVTAWYELFGQQVTLVNLYGPSETTLAKLFNRIQYNLYTDNAIVPLGKPISNTVALILNENKDLCTVEEKGEIYIKTPFITKGYYKDSELTLTKFIQNPLHSDFDDIVYKTGDYGKYLADGSVAFLGREDGQVKINGNRIELVEIEHAIRMYQGIKQVVVLSRYEGEQVFLVCYYTEYFTVNIDSLKTFLEEKLPLYMLPSVFVKLNQFILNNNGKIDKNALLKDKIEKIDIVYDEPQNEIEQKLELIWSAVLGMSKIGRSTSFFKVGGSSLKGIQIISRIYKQFGVLIKMPELFSNPTIEALSKLIAKTKEEEYRNIAVTAVKPYYSMSSSQRRLWILSQFEDSSAAYNMSGIYIFEGDVNVQALRNSFQVLLERHEILRTVFRENETGEICQFILKVEEVDFDLSFVNLVGITDQEIEIKQGIQQDFSMPFDLSQGILLRAKIYKIQENEFVFTYAMHHIISDGWSMGVLIKELLLLYNANVRGEVNPLKPLRIQYKDYTTWQQLQIIDSKNNSHRSYWIEQLSGDLPVLDLPSERKRPFVKTYNGLIHCAPINKELTSKLKHFCEQEEGTLFMGLLTLLNILLYKYTNQQDIIIGSPVAGRDHVDLEDQIGFYVNTLPLRSRFSGSDSFRELFHKTKTMTLEAYEHQQFPFDELVEALNLPRSMSRSPLFDVMLILQNIHQINQRLDIAQFDHIKVKSYEGDSGKTSKFDLTFNIVESGDELLCNIIYNTDIFSEEEVARFNTDFNELLISVLSLPDLSIQHQSYLSDSEKHKLLTIFNNIEEVYSSKQTIAELVEQQALRTPDHIAVVFEDSKLTYSELNIKANQIAHYLRMHYAIKQDDLVGILVDRSEWMLILMLGVLKSGAAYVPIDISYPAERISYILKESQPKLLISDRKEFTYAGEQLLLVDLLELVVQLPAANPVRVSDENSLAYVIYTSGSTGNPKGVMVEQRGVVNFLQSMTQTLNFSESDKILAVTTYSFDIAVLELFLPIINGGSVVIASRKVIQEPSTVERMITESEITTIQATPSFWKMLLENGWQGNDRLKVLSGGEKLSTDLCSKLFHLVHSLWNMYGPTETTIWSTCHKIERVDSLIPIGKPIHNTQVYILDSFNKLVGKGIIGEICIGGVGVSRGYYKNDNLTQARYITTDFSSGHRIYKTGDFGRWLSDGTLDCLGRTDDQVKIRGFRIELGEIEHVLSKHDQVIDAVVASKEDPSGELQLVAYLVSKEIIELSDLRLFLGQSLPDYMIPSSYVRLDSLPLTANGKVDRKALPDPAVASMTSATTYEPPGNYIEEKLVQIWEEILAKDKIGIHSDFFELGGHSFKVVLMQNKIKKEFNIRFSIEELFRRNTINKVANEISRRQWATAEIDKVNAIRI